MKKEELDDMLDNIELSFYESNTLTRLYIKRRLHNMIIGFDKEEYLEVWP